VTPLLALLAADARFVEPAVRAGPPPRSRPFVWGSSAYRELWDKAVAVGEVWGVELYRVL